MYEWVKNRIMGRSNRKGEYMLKFVNINSELMLRGLLGWRIELCLKVGMKRLKGRYGV